MHRVPGVIGFQLLNITFRIIESRESIEWPAYVQHNNLIHCYNSRSAIDGNGRHVFESIVVGQHGPGGDPADIIRELALQPSLQHGPVSVQFVRVPGR